jgi:hypothetical protein
MAKPEPAATGEREETAMNLSDRTTNPHAAAEIAPHVSLETFALIREAIAQRAQVWAYVGGRGIRFCPHALGWRGEDAYVQVLVLPERHGSVGEGGTNDGAWPWLLAWQWLKLADLTIPCLRQGEWITCAGDQRPATNFLTRLYCEAA